MGMFLLFLSDSTGLAVAGGTMVFIGLLAFFHPR